ncbi:sigma-54 interaction domain-containing protein [Alkalihalobacillus sp. 1P02AB]|uniref:sigma-54 interaction domain-containing protein n=1 Tax=Alkalihalobacillus sp. 1P02AB TaxID=3132260 RepID=UPI0039A6A493
MNVWGQMLETILELIDEAIHVVDQNGVTVYYNQVAASHDGLTRKEVLGKHLLDVFPSLSEDSSTLLKVMKTKKAIYQKSQTYKNNKGFTIDTINTTIPLFIDQQLYGAIEIAKDMKQIKQLSEKILELQQMDDNRRDNRKQTKEPKLSEWNDIMTDDPTMIAQMHIGKKAAETNHPIIVYGETGTGKELFVQALHRQSKRKNERFIVQNCASLPSSLLESLLFGTTKGSFTGAVDRKGLFELAHKGTLFLDEIQSMPLDFQAKILRTIEDGFIRRVGGTESYRIDVRIIVAMNQHPLECVELGLLRQDLYYRLSLFLIELPTLKERNEDIPILVDYFLKKANRPTAKLDANTVHLLQAYDWPGNIRELRHVIEYALTMSEEDTISLHHLPHHLQKKISSISVEKKSSQTLKDKLVKEEMSYIKDALKATGGNIKQAANHLGIPRQTLQYKLKKYQSNDERKKGGKPND